MMGALLTKDASTGLGGPRCLGEAGIKAHQFPRESRNFSDSLLS